MKRLAAVLLLFCCPFAHAQTVLTAPYVLGCANPAPAAAGTATVWPGASCKTPAFMPLTTTSVVASVSKTSPQWAHTLGGYAATNLVVACPIGASVPAGGAKCLNGTADASALVAVSAVPTFSLAPPIPTTKDYAFSWSPPVANTDGSPITDLTAYLVSNANSSIGPFLIWTMIGASITSYTYKALPTNKPQCFAIAGFSASSGIGQTLVFCQPTVSPVPGPVANAATTN